MKSCYATLLIFLTNHVNHSRVPVVKSVGLLQTPRPFDARARPLPRARPPLGAPRPAAPPARDIREAGAGVENFGLGLEESGGFSTKEVSVVLGGIS